MRLSEFLTSGAAGIAAAAIIVVVIKFLGYLRERDKSDAARALEIDAAFAEKDAAAQAAAEAFLAHLANVCEAQRNRCHGALDGVTSALGQVHVALARLNGARRDPPVPP